jgi:hypothetical protein
MNGTPRTDAVEYMAVEPYREKSLLEFFRDLESQVSALKADAERYRYLRALDEWEAFDTEWLCRLNIYSGSGDDLDAAIDSARAAT